MVIGNTFNQTFYLAPLDVFVYLAGVDNTYVVFSKNA